MNCRKLAQAAVLMLLISWMGTGDIASQEVAPAMTTPDELSPAQAQADLDVLRSALEEAHGGLYRFSTKDELGRRFERIHLKTIRPSFTTWKPKTYEDLQGGVVPAPKGGCLATPKLHSGVAVQSPAALPFLGNLFVLLDGGTFSTAADVTAILRHWRRATFVGEESGGTYEGNTSNLNALVILPNSKLQLKVMMYGYWNAVSGGGKGRGTLPDQLRGVDAPWERAFALANAE